MNQLVSLTQALRGIQTNNHNSSQLNINELNECINNKKQMEAEQLLRNKRMIRRQLREFALETNSKGTVVIDKELERAHDSLIYKPSDDTNMDDLEQGEPMVTATDEISSESLSDSLSEDDDDMPLINLSTSAAAKGKKKKKSRPATAPPASALGRQTKVRSVSGTSFIRRSQSESFEHNVEQLKAHKEKYGHFNVDWKNSSLYAFCNSVRSSYRFPSREYHRIKLNEHRIALLDSIGFDWTYNPPQRYQRKKRKYNEEKSNDNDESMRKQPPEELVYQAQPLSKTKDTIRERQDAIEILAGMKTSSTRSQHGLTHNLIGKKQDTKKRKATEKSSKKRIYNPSMQWGSGVTPLRDNKWQAQISYNSKPQYIGMFDSKEVALLAVKLARDKLTTPDGSTYEGDELKRIIKCARDAAHAGEQAQVTATASSSTTTAKGQSRRKLCSHEGCDSFARGKEGTCVKHSASYQMAVDPNLGGGTCSHCNKTFTTEAGLLYHLGESCFVLCLLMLFVAY